MTGQRVSALVLLAAFYSFATLAQDAVKKRSPRPELRSIALPALGEIPKAEGITPAAPEKLAPEPTVVSGSATYAVTKIQHARSFFLSRVGPLPIGGAIDRISLAGKPPSTQKFSTAVRVKSPQKADAPVEVLVLDPRGEVAMSAVGELRFRKGKGDEADYVVDWDAVPCRWSGDFLVAVRVAGRPMGTWPLKVVEPNAGLGNTSARNF